MVADQWTNMEKTCIFFILKTFHQGCLSLVNKVLDLLRVICTFCSVVDSLVPKERILKDLQGTFKLPRCQFIFRWIDSGETSDNLPMFICLCVCLTGYSSQTTWPILLKLDMDIPWAPRMARTHTWVPAPARPRIHTNAINPSNQALKPAQMHPCAQSHQCYMLYWLQGYSLKRAPKVLMALRAMTADIHVMQSLPHTWPAGCVLSCKNYRSCQTPPKDVV